MLVECSDCGQKKQRIRHHQRARGGWVCVDEDGRTWDAAKCNACKNLRTKARSRRKYGHRSRDEAQEHCSKTGRDSEHTARKHFEALGYKVTMVDVKGPDLTLVREDERLLVEVKTATRQPRTTRSFFVSAVSPLRTGDDLIAYVFKDRVVVRAMKDHLKERDSWGQVTVSRFFTDPGDAQVRRKTLSGYKGVHQRPYGFFAYISHEGRQLALGTYPDATQAARAYDAKAKEIYGEFAYLNFPDD